MKQPDSVDNLRAERRAAPKPARASFASGDRAAYPPTEGPD
jgi:hypothetical protein